MKFAVTEYGAVGDGKTLNTKAIQQAIRTCSEAGGGEVVFPNGCYISGSLEILDGVTLYLEKGAVLKASTDLKDYVPLPLPQEDVGNMVGFIYSIGHHDIGLAGSGTIDFSGDAFFDENQRMPFAGMGDELTERQRAETTLAIFPRPTQPIRIDSCENVVLTDIRLVNSPCWTATISGCHHVIADRVTVENSLLIPNCDGIGFGKSTDVTVSNCHISCADDCLTFCGSQNVTVTNCVLRTRSSAIRIGYIDGDTENVTISNIVIHDSNRGIILQGSQNSRINNVLIQNVAMHNRLFLGNWWGSGEPLTIIASDEGEVRHVMMTNVRAVSAHGIAMRGLPSGNVSDILLRDWQLTITREGESEYSHFIDFRDQEIYPLDAEQMPWYYAENVDGLFMENMQVSTDGDGDDADITPIILHTNEC